MGPVVADCSWAQPPSLGKFPLLAKVLFVLIGLFQFSNGAMGNAGLISLMSETPQYSEATDFSPQKVAPWPPGTFLLGASARAWDLLPRLPWFSFDGALFFFRQGPGEEIFFFLSMCDREEFSTGTDRDSLGRDSFAQETVSRRIRFDSVDLFVCLSFIAVFPLRRRYPTLFGGRECWCAFPPHQRDFQGDVPPVESVRHV